MLVDSFLFFQELDLLEIRLKYLYPYIDKFIIIESCQTFNGSKKDYIFEKNINKFSRYLEKIFYYKITDFHQDPESLITYLEKNKNKNKKFIANLLKSHNYYNKSIIWQILDSYQRECIHLALKKICKPSDLVIFSDVDEIPSIKVIKKLINKDLNLPLVCKQYEFKYFLNCLNRSDWNGSIISKYSYLKNRSLNLMRHNSNNLNSLEKGGYHFTSMGNEKTIKNKIENWTHQEFNTPEIKNNILKNIQFGRDIFYRFGVKKNKIINLSKKNIIDKRLTKIILNYEELIIKKIEKENIFEFLNYKFTQIKLNLKRIIKNPFLILNKISFLIKKHFDNAKGL